MSKRVRIEPIAQEADIETNGNLLSVLMQEDLNILKECGGRGMCATCHVYIQEGMNSLSPIGKREQRTLEVITTCTPNSRLACQAKVMAEGVVVELPVGMYIQSIQDIEALIGRRCEKPMLHPVTGQTLVEVGQLITRSMVRQLESTDFRIGEQLSQTKRA
ncbi:ferredoxin [Synechococcus sp. PCC 7502]|uniref:2Fe-2S iron-sulfur cluster-binding protein n=1 Tax=Synechococcus sp. PCC 7502 TaxID=1173263 RepID=UPI00029F8757|nr:2Fe-2S iron-sulfur cluster-binding protein [Synechococcus sp. PCC 7502]AFY74634.1 ferredoxin [Synechococcus sp. PCC 7502]